MDAGTFVVGDVRTQGEYDGHITCWAEPKPRKHRRHDARSPARHGRHTAGPVPPQRRSKEASDKLLALGYRNVYDFGGMIDWPYDVVKE